MPAHHMNGKPVHGTCINCGRPPDVDEKYGIGPKDWDFTNMCPKCWDSITGGDA